MTAPPDTSPRPGASAVRVGLVYPELLGTYGDRGNAVVLERRLRWRGIPAELLEVPAGDPVPAGIDIYCLGGGEDTSQALAAAGLIRSRTTIERARERGAVVFGVCAGFQILGVHYEQEPGDAVDGLGLVDAVTVAGPDRLIGECLVAPPDGASLSPPALAPPLPPVSGFENHAGRTHLGEGVRAFGRLRRGHGNGDGTDGALGERLLATYLHGPVLARNPALADLLLGWVVGTLPPLDDRLPERLHAERVAAARP